MRGKKNHLVATMGVVACQFNDNDTTAGCVCMYVCKFKKLCPTCKIPSFGLI